MDVHASLDILWMLFSAVLVLLMQGGFLCLESGFTRSKNAINVALKNAADFVISFVAWWAVGFGLMFGHSEGGWLGSGPFLPSFNPAEPFSTVFFLFQVMFCATAATVVSGAVAERIRYSGYHLVTLMTVCLIYPVFGHWAWGGALGGESGWLADMGFVDFAGSTVVHSLGGWVALAAVLVIGPRKGRFVDGEPRSIPASNVPLAALGLIFFVIGWVGFNGGSTLGLTSAVPGIVANTVLAGVAGGIAAHIATGIRRSRYVDRVAAPINGVIAGLVSITAGCHALSAPLALVTGGVGALLMLGAMEWLGRRQIDDAIGAIPVHLAAGVWGTLAVGLFGEPDALGTGLGRFEQLAVQSFGILMCGVWTFVTAYLLLHWIDRRWPLRVSEQDEHIGLNVAEHGARTDLIDLMQAMRKQEETADHALRLPVEPFTEVGQIAQQHNRLMDALDRAVAHTKAIIRDIRDGIVTFSSEGILTSLNPGAEKIFGVPAIEAVGMPLGQLLELPTEVTGVVGAGSGAPEEKFDVGWLVHRETVELTGRRRDREAVYLEITVTGNSEAADQFTALVRDVTDRRQVEEQLFREKEQAQVTLDSIADGVVTTDAAGRVVYMNTIAEQLTCWARDSASGLPLHRVLPVVDSPSQRPDAWLSDRVLRENEPIVETRSRLLYCRDGNVHVVQLSAAPIRDRLGQATGVVVVFHDVTQARVMERQLSYQATHDALTGLINRAEFERQLQTLIEESSGTRDSHVLCYIDLDQFKLVNDVCGHAAGDELLRQLSDVLRQRLRSHDTLARLGGDEFGVLLQHCTIDKGMEIAEHLRSNVRDFRFLWEGRSFAVGASIGLVPISGNSGTLAKTLRLADAACYAAKDAGRNRVHLYQSDDHEMAARTGQMQWINRIQRALDSDGFRLYYQTIVPTEGTHTPGGHFEVLVRMVDKNGDVIPPGAFIPAAERYDLMSEVDEWVVRNSLRWLGEKHRSGGGEIHKCAINLSGASIGRDHCLAMLKRYLNEYQVPPQKVCFEITETAAVANLRLATRLITELKAIGCQFALDDFGSGLSSFGYLKNLPVEYLKIDGAFVREVHSNRVDHAMVDSINSIGHVMGIKTIAEFVESEEILQCLCELGIDYVQGYHIAPPRPLDEWAPAEGGRK